MTNAVAAKSLNAPMAQDAEELRWQRQIAVSGQTQMQRVSCRIRVSLPAMPALFVFKRKTSVAQLGCEEDEEPDEARGDLCFELFAGKRCNCEVGLCRAGLMGATQPAVPGVCQPGQHSGDEVTEGNDH